MVKHNLIEDDYNKGPKLCQSAVDKLNKKMNTEIKTLRELSLDDFKKYGDILEKEELQRVKYVLEENERVEKCIKACQS